MSRSAQVSGAVGESAEAIDADDAELHGYLRERLSPTKTPKLWFHVDEFPLTGSGKIQKFAIREKWERGDYG